jgi:hypothetical protein
MVEIRPPADGVAPPPSTIGGASIEIGTSVMPRFDDFAMPAPEAISTAAMDTSPAPATVAAGGTSKLLWWAIGGASLFFGGGLVAVMLLSSNESTVPPPAAAADATAESPAASNDSSVATDQSPDAVPEGKSVEAPPAIAPETTPSETEAAVEPDKPAEVLPAPEERPAETAQAAESLANEPPLPGAPSAVPTQASQRLDEKPSSKLVMSLDPLDFDPSQFRFDTNIATPTASDSNSIPKGVDTATSDVPNGPASENTPVSEASKVDRSLTMRLGPMPNGNAGPHRVAEQLGTHLEAFAVVDMPLSRFVNLVSDMADVAVTLDPFEMELAGVMPRQNVGIDAKDVTVERILRDVLAKQRLDLVEHDGQLGIALGGGDTRREVTLDVADLASTQDATPIASLVQRFVAPQSWTAAGGSGSIQVEISNIRIEQSQRVRHEVLIFCERLRVARGLSQRSRYPASLLATASAYDAAEPALKARTTFTLLPWARLADVARHWQEASKLTILIDWRALAAMELGPSSPVACSAIDRSWEEVLDGMLEPIGLAWWPVNGETVQITSQDALDDIQRIEFYTVRKALRDQHASKAALIESLQEVLADANSKAPPVIEFDEPSGRLIVLGDPRVHRALHRRLRM